jgi:hypothetical protein
MHRQRPHWRRPDGFRSHARLAASERMPLGFLPNALREPKVQNSGEGRSMRLIKLTLVFHPVLNCTYTTHSMGICNSFFFERTLREPKFGRNASFEHCPAARADPGDEGFGPEKMLRIAQRRRAWRQGAGRREAVADQRIGHERSLLGHRRGAALFCGMEQSTSRFLPPQFLVIEARRQHDLPLAQHGDGAR